MKSLGFDLAGEILASHALDNATATAGGAGDNTAVNGNSLDLTALSDRPNSVAFLIPVKATVADTKNCVLTAKIEHSDNGSTWTDLVAVQTLLTLVVAGGGTTRGVGKIGADLRTSAKRYIRVTATMDLSATATDTSAMSAVAVWGGLNRI